MTTAITARSITNVIRSSSIRAKRYLETKRETIKKEQNEKLPRYGRQSSQGSWKNDIPLRNNLLQNDINCHERRGFIVERILLSFCGIIAYTRTAASDRGKRTERKILQKNRAVLLKENLRLLTLCNVRGVQRFQSLKVRELIFILRENANRFMILPPSVHITPTQGFLRILGQKTFYLQNLLFVIIS